ncbi:CHASE2 domain-containing protein [Phormidesmis sp. 146-35]
MLNVEKLVVLKLDGDFEQGFRVALEVGIDGDRPAIEMVGFLPANSELVMVLHRWQQAYRSLGHHTRIVPQEIIYGGSVNQLDDCRSFARELHDRLNTWLDSPAFRGIDRRLREALSPEEVIRILVRSQDEQIQRLPWQSWNLLERYPKAEIALSVPTLERIQVDRSPDRPVRILAILGNQSGIDVEADRRILEQLPAEVTFLVEPPRQQITQQLWNQPWDILFFAGHSQTEGNHGRIYLNPQESLTLEELKYGLRQAIAQGLQLAIFNSCDGLGFAQEFAQLHLPQMIVMREPVPDPVAQAFLKVFLSEFTQGESLYLASRRSREQLQGLEHDFPCASWLPVLCQHSPDPPPRWHTLSRQKEVSVPRSSLRLRLFTSGLITALILGIRWLGGLQSLELAAFDRLMRLRPSEGLDQRLLVVKATEKDFQQLQEYPLSDRTVTQLLQKLERYEAQAIGLDLYRDIPQGTGRAALLQHLQTSDRVIVPCKLPDQRSQGIAPPPDIPPDSLGFTDVVVDPDRVIRRQVLSVSPKPGVSCSTGYALSFLLAARYLADKGKPNTVTNNNWQLGKVLLPRLQVPTGGYSMIETNGSQILLNYRAPIEVAQQVTVTQVLNDPDPDYIRDRIVLIGVDIEDIDRFATPYSRDNSQTLPGVVIHAQMVSQLLSAVLDQRPLLWVWSPGVEGLWIWGWSIAGVWVAGMSVWTGRTGLLYWSITSAGVLILLGGICFGWLKQGGWIPLVPSAIAFSASSGSLVIYNTFLTKKRLQKQI